MIFNLKLLKIKTMSELTKGQQIAEQVKTKLAEKITTSTTTTNIPE